MQQKSKDSKNKTANGSLADLGPIAEMFYEDSSKIQRQIVSKEQIQNIESRSDRASELKLATTKINTKGLNRLSNLAKWILVNAGDGIKRGEIVERYFGIERLYCGFYVDACYSIREKRRRQRRCRHVQPQLSMTLKRMEQRGLVQLIRPRRYVKKIYLTSAGKTLAEQLMDNGGVDRSRNE